MTHQDAATPVLTVPEKALTEEALSRVPGSSDLHLTCAPTDGLKSQVGVRSIPLSGNMKIPRGPRRHSFLVAYANGEVGIPE